MSVYQWMLLLCTKYHDEEKLKARSYVYNESPPENDPVGIYCILRKNYMRHLKRGKNGSLEMFQNKLFNGF